MVLSGVNSRGDGVDSRTGGVDSRGVAEGNEGDRVVTGGGGGR